MIKQVTWKRYNVPVDGVEEFLTEYNFQPGMFHIIPLNNLGNLKVAIIAVEMVK
jgi:hypothetical protein